ncbi:MAG: glycosyltransferase family 4 protein [Magnetococcales bacterium]|nr:glycosyltransferase family 4 protein [Magnetococcales bacterium]
MTANHKMVLTWSLGHYHGWGVYGLNLVLAMLRRGITPRLLQAPGALELDPLQARLLLGVLENSADYVRARQLHPNRTIREADTIPLIHSDGRMDFDLTFFSGRPGVGMTFFEYADLDAAVIERARSLAAIITGSLWNQRILKEKYGLKNAHYVMQGVETTQFFPSGRRGLLHDKFVIFSGGKLEFRKGQDIVVATFRRFRERHPEAFLLTAWHNRWADAGQRFAATYVDGFPMEGGEALQQWMGRHLPSDSFMDVGMVANPRMAELLREVDCALFPNRCEGGTNLVAMECMATGVPVVLSRNTGHEDLIEGDRCLILRDQQPVCSPVTGVLLQDWGESSVEEALAALEWIYQGRDRAQALGRRGHEFMMKHSWNCQCDHVLDIIVGHNDRG